MKGKYLLVVTGPTAIGKTSMAIRLNKLLNTSIISADSRQVYKEMTIGTAKPSPEEIMTGNIKLVDHISVVDHYNAGSFCLEAKEIIHNDLSTKSASILCGGTGLYISALTEGLHDFPKIEEDIIKSLNREFQDTGLTPLLKELEEKDPNYFNNADIQNPRRVIRALQVIRQSGKPYSYFTSKAKIGIPYPVIEIILELPREQLYNKINNRVDSMIRNGLVEEVQSLVKYKHNKALQTVGYAEIFNYLDGSLSLDASVEEIKKNSRRYAKRQLTWISRYKTKERFHPEEFDSIVDYIRKEGLKDI